MSRSTRKPIFTQQQYTRNGGASKAKRTANKVIRDSDFEDTPKNGKSYRKYSCSWNIRDWSHFSKDPKAKRK